MPTKVEEYVQLTKHVENIDVAAQPSKMRPFGYFMPALITVMSIFKH